MNKLATIGFGNKQTALYKSVSFKITYKIELRLSQSIIEYNNKLITSVHVQHTCMDRMVAGLTVTL